MNAKWWDTIEHYIFHVNLVKPFLSEIEQWWNEKSLRIVGLYYKLTYFSAIHYVVLLGKMYIYSEKH